MGCRCTCKRACLPHYKQRRFIATKQSILFVRTMSCAYNAQRTSAWRSMMNETILYVDDDDSNLVVFQAACGREFEVLTANSGVQAMDIMRSQGVALLIADQRMPGMSGVEVLERVRNDYPDVVRILITAYSDFQEATAAINRGQIHRFLKKPWVIDELRANLTEALRCIARVSA